MTETINKKKDEKMEPVNIKNLVNEARKRLSLNKVQKSVVADLEAEREDYVNRCPATD